MREEPLWAPPLDAIQDRVLSETWRVSTRSMATDMVVAYMSHDARIKLSLLVSAAAINQDAIDRSFAVEVLDAINWTATEISAFRKERDKRKAIYTEIREG